jgi:hypothetical protein
MTTKGNQYRGTREFHLVYCELIRAARSRDLLYYADVARILRVHPTGHHMARQVGQVLGEVSEEEHQAGRPMLSAVAVNAAGFPGDGFYVLARRLGKLTDHTSEDAFLRSEREAVYGAWAEHQDTRVGA